MDLISEKLMQSSLIIYIYIAIIWQKMKKNTSWKFTDESSVTFQLSVSGPGEFGHTGKRCFLFCWQITYIDKNIVSIPDDSGAV